MDALDVSHLARQITYPSFILSLTCANLFLTCAKAKGVHYCMSFVFAWGLGVGMGDRTLLSPLIPLLVDLEL
jgi:hypothetical protein